MKRFLCTLVLCCASSPILAEEPVALSPIQQYLAYESGYAPGVLPMPEETEPYDTAYVPIYPDQNMEPSAYDTQHLNQGVSGMNF